MKAAICLLALVVVPIYAAEETAVTPRVDSVGLFKNSVAVVRASFEVKGPGVYCWQDLPRAVHGSFWVESDGQVTIRSTTRMLEDPEPVLPSGILQRDLAGAPVTVKLKSTAPAQEPLVSGKVWTMPEFTPRRIWDNSMPTNDPWASMRAWTVTQANGTLPTASAGNFLVLEPEKGGRQYLDLGSIASVSVDGPIEAKKRKLEKPVMIFEVGQAPANGGRVQISYLARGIAWAPSYLIDLAGTDQLSIRRNAVVRNELIDLKDTEVQLISGFPNIEFAHVDSPLWAGGSLAAFFQQLSQQPGSPGGMASQQMVMYNTMTPSGGGAAALPNLAEAGGGDDVHFESIGPRSLAPGDSLSLEIASAKTACQRVVEWVVPDPRDEYGRYRRESGSSQQQQKDEDAPWDALKFTNPFKFPLTTGPAMITESGRFRGQSLSQWVNPGQSTCLRVTKALSIDARYAEVEEEQQRELVWIGGNDFQKTKVKGTMVVRNFRGKDSVMSIRACFSGEMIDAEGNPAAKLRTEGVSSVNPRRELEWTLKLAAGEEKTLSYRYSVLVDR
ncbi:hypothetical protein [Haloferula sp. BvORR071]|uniref:hypothetical protein n=1 Tax=Haloferula sp. BvORR071 TaxID=1396141 RepID=UPI0005595175|nr:hypothetical protein [Haloferula sp. BvORR071]